MRIRWGFVVFVLLAVVFVLYSAGPDIESLVSILFVADLVFGVVAVIYGGRTGRPGVIVGGVLCLLVTFGSVTSEPGAGTLLMQVLAGVVGLGPVLVSGASRVLD